MTALVKLIKRTQYIRAYIYITHDADEGSLYTISSKWDEWGRKVHSYTFPLRKKNPITLDDIELHFLMEFDAHIRFTDDTLTPIAKGEVTWQ